jgi:hypothetical protein
MITSRRWVAWVGILFVTFSSFAVAGEASDDFRLDVAPAKPFARGTKTLEFEGSYTSPIRFSEEEFVTGTVGVGYYLFDNHSVTLLAQGFHVSQFGGEDAEAGAVIVLGRSILCTADRFSFYIDGGGGYSWANNSVPVGGTKYNFTARAGLGVAWRLADDPSLLGGARYFHLSNAQAHGKEKNPSYDGVEYYVGLMFTFP